jgi:hypothetical protein
VPVSAREWREREARQVPSALPDTQAARRHRAVKSLCFDEPLFPRVEPDTTLVRMATKAAATGHTCIVPDCKREGRNRLGVRCRIAHDGPTLFPDKGKTAALFSPDAEAFLCDHHALGGAAITLIFEANGSKQTTIKVIAATTVEERTTDIKQPS